MSPNTVWMEIALKKKNMFWTSEPFLKHENKFRYMRTHSNTREHILIHENTFWNMRTYSIAWQRRRRCHVTHTHESRFINIHENTFWNMRTYSIAWQRRRRCHVTHTHESRFTNEWVIPHIRTRHVVHASCVTHVSHMCHTCVTHEWMSPVTPPNESCYTYELSHVPLGPDIHVVTGVLHVCCSVSQCPWLGIATCGY